MQAGLSLCWPYIPHCWKRHVTPYLCFKDLVQYSVENTVVNIIRALCIQNFFKSVPFFENTLFDHIDGPWTLVFKFIDF